MRPEDVEVFREARNGGVRGVLADRLTLPLRNTTLFTIRVGEHEVYAQIASSENHRVGDPVWLTFRRYHLFEKASGLRLRSGAGTDWR